ncbi:tRNA (guanosine(46)-N7)-methyltransferase TrmB [Megasphaera vaginalis (ex Srinivasan et al. 2021)]|uniref:tRNA (guanine-N(7)-)-methyltransferase n=1 Tax=Megasphaera vaginalis (ex Srinivasan et al. 2021) TaxID=1111454 RepID=U7UIN1_9FIRM|nr:tRNA (guanosine(46)-N7)-methyltransferase TrmB [Megasphaera vaginalis (ex Srinivasan et al. 2021)]ERT59146.1 tRNA (guanine-N(7)-)-methyltransferase [Megasphaera vaginalis (ex Srinivasan et al. 2021)]
MRLRRKPWIDEAVKEFESFVCLDAKEEMKGRWRSLFADPAAPLWVEIGTGKGNFIAQMAQLHGDVNFIGIEVQLGVLYYAAKKCAAAETENVRLLRFDAAALESIFAAQEIDRIFINFCDPWPKKRHAKRRLTYRLFLDRYCRLLRAGGCLCFKSDNRGLFDFTLEELTARRWSLSEVTYDLHNSDIVNEAMTEYEAKFSAKGQPIFHCLATRPTEVRRDEAEEK